MATSVIPLNGARKHPLAQCETCPMNGPRFKFVPSDGKQDSDLIVIGEAPGIDEIIHRKPFVGPSGKLMKETLRKGGIDSDRVFYTNAVLCHPPDNKLEPYKRALDCCRPRLEAELNAIGDDSTPILAVGKHGAQAAVALTQGTHAPKSLSIIAQHGRTYQPTATARVRKRVHLAVHPAYVLRVPSVYGEFLLDVQRIFSPAQEHSLHTAPGYRICWTMQDLLEDLAAIPNGSWVSMDVETNNLIWYDRPSAPKERLLMIGIAASTEYVTIVPEILIRGSETAANCRQALIDFVERVKICGHNGKFDALVLQAWGFWNARIDFDTMLAHGSIKETPPHGLKELAAYYYSVEDYEADLVLKYFPSQKKSDRQYSLVPQEHLAQYLAWDCATTLQLREDMQGEMITQGVEEWPFNNLLMRASAAFVKVERAGIKVDVPYLGGHVKPLLENDQYLTLLGLRDMIGDSKFNPNSTQQVAHILYDVYGFKPAQSKHFPKRSTCAAALKQIGPELENHVFTKLFMQYRRIGKLLSSYVNPILRLVDTRGYIHASYRLLGAETGRLSATDPAIQTLPRAARDRDKYGPLIRESFIAETGWKLVIADYSQAEMRVWCHLCQDPFLLKCYREGRDLHSEGAIRLFGPNYTKEQRTWVKNFNFAYVYGGNEYSFAGQYNLPILEAKAFVNEYEAMMPVARAWRDIAFQDAIRKGYVETPLGRRRRFTLITPETHDEIRKTAWNFPPQSIASDITLLALCELSEANYNVVLMVHDSIGIHCPANEAEATAKMMQQVMVSVGERYITSVPWKVDVDIQDRWELIPEDAELEDAIPILDSTEDEYDEISTT